MDETMLLDYMNRIKGADEKALQEARNRQEKLVKPPGSLGKLEDISVKMAGIRGRTNSRVESPCIMIFSADNGVVEEGVSSAPQSVTMAQTINFTKYATGVGALAKGFSNQLCIVDVGVNFEFPDVLTSKDMYDFVENKIIDRKIAMGSKNLAKQPAMSRQQALKAIFTGIEAVQAVKEKGYDILGVGEMGIGNTTTGAAILCSLMACPAERAVGRGGGINNASFNRKKKIVDEAAQKSMNHDIIDILSHVGGFDICAMTGAYIGAAAEEMPIVIDGFISIVAALVATRLEPKCRDYMFASHMSEEIGYNLAMEELEIEPMLHLNMRLGEGSGCAIAFEVIKAAQNVICDMATFEEAAIDDEYLDEIRRGGCF